MDLILIAGIKEKPGIGLGCTYSGLDEEGGGFPMESLGYNCVQSNGTVQFGGTAYLCRALSNEGISIMASNYKEMLKILQRKVKVVKYA